MDIALFSFYGNQVKLDVLTSRKEIITELRENDFLMRNADTDSVILIKGTEKTETLYNWCRENSSQELKLKRNEVSFIFYEKVLN